MRGNGLKKRIMALIMCASLSCNGFPINARAENLTMSETDIQAQTEESVRIKESAMADSETMEYDTGVQSVTETLAGDESETGLTETSESESSSSDSTESETSDVQTSTADEELQTVTEENSVTEEIPETEGSETETAVIYDNNDIRVSAVENDVKLNVEAERIYYSYNGRAYVVVKLSGFNTEQFEPVFLVRDGEDYNEDSEFKQLSESGVYVKEYANVADNTKLTTRIELRKKNSDNENPVENYSLDFTIRDTRLWTPLELYYASCYAETINFGFYSDKNMKSDDNVLSDESAAGKKLISKILLKKGTEVFGEASESDLKKDICKYDPRYESVALKHELKEGDLYKYSCDLEIKTNSLPEGDYDIELVFADGSVQQISNIVKAVNTGVIHDCTMAADYDNTGEFCYLYLEGAGLENPLSYNYSMQRNDTGAKLYVRSVSYKQTANGYIVKFQKSDKSSWEDIHKTKVNLMINNLSYNVQITVNDFELEVKHGIFYAEYNASTGNVEIGITDDIASDSVRFEIKKADGTGINNSIVGNTDGLYIVKPEAKLTRGTYTVSLGNGTPTYERSFTVNASDEASFWDASEKVSQKSAYRSYFYYYSTEILKEETADVKVYALASDSGAENSAEEVDVTSTLYISEWERENESAGSCVKISVTTSKLAPGSYRLVLTQDSKLVSEFKFEVMADAAEKFLLESFSISWKDENTIQMYMKTPNTSESDSYTVYLTDINGSGVGNLKTEVTNRYSGCVYLEITGLARKTAYKKYYVLVEHDSYGKAKTINDYEKDYFADSRGEFAEIRSYMGALVNVDGRAVGINVQGMSFPVSLNLYKTTDTTGVASITLEDESAVKEGVYYYFPENFAENQDKMYDLLITDATGWSRAYSGISIGYKNYVSPSDIKVDLSGQYIYLNTDEKTVKITVSENTGRVVFESSDDDIADVRNDKDNPNIGIVTGKKHGTVEINIAVDGIEKTVVIYIVDKVDYIWVDTIDQNMNVGDSIVVSAYVSPEPSSEDIPYNMTFSSSDDSVLSVQMLPNSRNQAKVTAMNAGKAALRVVLDDTQFSKSVNFNITNYFSLYEKRELISLASDNYYIENADKSLADIELPAGWKWIDDTISPTVGTTDATQYYDAIYKIEGYQTFSARLPVNVLRITGVKVDGQSLINPGKTALYDVAFDYTGNDINADKVRERLSISCRRTDGDDVADVDAFGVNSVRIKAKNDTGGGRDVFEYALIIDGMYAVKDQFEVTVPSKACIDSITIEPIRASGQRLVYNPANNTVEIDSAELRNTSKYMLELKATAAINETLKKNFEAVWSISDSSVAKLIKDKEGKVYLQLMKPGVCTVTASANDAGKAEGKLYVYVMDYTPVVDDRSVSLNIYRKDGAALNIQEQNGNNIKSIKVFEGETESENFTVTKPENGIAVLSAKKGAPVNSIRSKKNYDCILMLTTDKGIYESKLRISASASLPSARIKMVSRANVFYTDASAEYLVTSDYEIDKIESVDSKAIGFKGVYDKKTGVITFETNGTLTQDTLPLFKNNNSEARNVKLRISYSGFDMAQDINLKVATEYKPAAMSIGKLSLYNGVNTGSAALTDKKSKNRVILDNSYSVTVADANVNGIKASVNRNGCVDLSYTGSKGVSYKLMVGNKRWTQDIMVQGKIEYLSDAKKLGIAMTNSQVILNMGTNIRSNGYIYIPVSVSGNESLKLNSVRFASDAYNRLAANDYLHIRFDSRNQRIELGINEGRAGTVNAGTYKIDLYGTIKSGDNEIELKKTALTIKLTQNNAAKVTLASAKGKLNLIDRGNTSIIYVPKLSGINANIKSVSTSGNYGDLFKAELLDDGRLEIKAKSGKDIQANHLYELGLKFTMDNKYVIETVARIKPVNSYYKVKMNPSKGVLYRTNANSAEFELSIPANRSLIKNISAVRLDTSKGYGKYFTIADNVAKNGTIDISIAGRRTELKKGTYSLTCMIYFKDAPGNVKPYMTNIKIVVK